MRFNMYRYNKNGTLATSLVLGTLKEARESVLHYLSYDLLCPCWVNFTPLGKPNKLIKYEGEAGLIQVKMELGLIPDEDLLGYLHTNDAINAIIADRIGMMV